MQMKRRSVYVGLLLLILFAFCINYAYSAMKKSTNYHDIRIAYINGYYEALHLNIDVIKQLQADEEKLKQAVLDAADRYIREVEKLNEQKSK